MKKKVVSYSYAELHNKAVKNYQKCMVAFLFIAILNTLGAILGVSSDKIPFFPSLGICSYLGLLMINSLTYNLGTKLLIVLISILFSSIYVIIWSFCRSGKKISIILGIIFYLCDAIFSIIYFAKSSYLIPQLALHIIIFFFLGYGLANYYQVFSIEHKFNKDKKEGE